MGRNLNLVMLQAYVGSITAEGVASSVKRSRKINPVSCVNNRGVNINICIAITAVSTCSIQGIWRDTRDGKSGEGLNMLIFCSRNFWGLYE